MNQILEQALSVAQARMRDPILLTGPTASGKSTLALSLAQKIHGAIINADSMQIYREWRILTARPTKTQETLAPHYLYGTVSVQENYSVGRWLQDLETVLLEVTAANMRPIIVGGTGLYFSALTKGLTRIPPIPQKLRIHTQELLQEIGCDGLFKRLQERDPQTAAKIDRSNPARLRRAWEVLEATGKGISEWRKKKSVPLIEPKKSLRMLIDIDHKKQEQLIRARLINMVQNGAFAEAENIMQMQLPAAAPARKVLGARVFAQAAKGQLSKTEAIDQAVIETRQYGKRQQTWFRNQMPDWQRLKYG